MNDYEIKRLRALLEGLECQEIDELICDATPDVLRAIGAEIAKAAKLGSLTYRLKAKGVKRKSAAAVDRDLR